MKLASRQIARTLACTAFAAFAVSAAFTGSAFAVATAEPLDLDPDILAEIARQRARAATQARQPAGNGKAGKGATAPGTECGAVNIGNVLGAGRIGFAPIDVNVVIVGDVVNANNKCK